MRLKSVLFQSLHFTMLTGMLEVLVIELYMAWLNCCSASWEALSAATILSCSGQSFNVSVHPARFQALFIDTGIVPFP